MSVRNSQTSTHRILVADDDPAVLHLVTSIVEKENCTVVPAKDGREAYELLQNGPTFMICIFDVIMPHIQGPELVRYMKSEKRLMNIPVMMMSGGQDLRLSFEGLASGAMVLLPKPFTTSQLQIMLRMLMSKAGA